MSSKIRIAIIGAGAVSDYHHVPGIRLDQRAELVAACDPNEELLAKRLRDWGAIRTTTSKGSLGVRVDVDHTAATPPGFTVTVDVECTEVVGKKISFKVKAHDGVDQIGAGRHERFVVPWDKFNARVAEKTAKAAERV